ncbi:hypothetical protein KAM479_30820 [Aeromonas caviae]|uniref:DUF4113 domain-containing protein n=2 Tax=Aeromonas caviae TaxID=648 RepID=UPI0009BA3B53|nr:DUF4113 domain-containing protein [Aeromonas caviae]BDN93120.1 hypothetical protein KAM497c_26640 [Aeromonas caviae]GJA16255.1 hypothetical protein KAM335_34510 [Aeromonas caviae]GJA25005.1 hypothetical protein KAM337_35330 [Aeromonas caviae]GJB21668.1 hypothetical protein KAM364_35800 [Aeromonas caviae]GKR71161.1 hypothetical protein KAM479_30820 [Aeromonas caviae]
MPPLKAQLLLAESLAAYFPEMVFTDSGITVQIHRNTHRYQKGGVMLSEFTPKGQQQADLFAPSSAQSDALMAVMDQIKAKGLGRVGLASQGTGSTNWMMRQEHLSPCYISRWEDLPVVR